MPSPTLSLTLAGGGDGKTPPGVLALPTVATSSPQPAPTATPLPTSSLVPPVGKIVFEVDVGEAGIYAMDADGTNLTRLITQVGDMETGRPLWSPDGKFIAYLNSTGNEPWYVQSLWIMDREGGDPRRLSAVNTPVYGFSSSADGSSIAYVAGESPSARSIFIVDIAEGVTRKVLGPGELGTSVAWSPDSRWIAFTSSTEDTSAPELNIFRPDGSEQTRLANDVSLASTASSLSRSPDANVVATACDFEGNSDICIFTVYGRGFARLTEGSGIDEQPAWSPNGRMIAFTSGQPQGGFLKTDVFVANVDGAGLRSLTDFPRSDGPTYFLPPPIWSPDGTVIGFVSQQGKSQEPQELYLVSADGGGLTQITSGLVLAIESFDWILP